ncbi:hypothetical protein, partial [Haloarcula sp. CBA1122]
GKQQAVGMVENAKPSIVTSPKNETQCRRFVHMVTTDIKTGSGGTVLSVSFLRTCGIDSYAMPEIVNLMATSVSEYVDYEEDDGVGIWKIEDLPAAIEAGDMEKAEQHYVETASDPEMESVVVTIGGVEEMDSKVLDHVEDNWTDVAEQSDVDFTAYVADGIARLSISQKNEADNVLTKGFKEFEPALEWAKEKQNS